MTAELFQEGELADAPSRVVQQGYDLWNEFAAANKWQVAKVLDTGRRSALKRAIRDYGGIGGFRLQLEKIQRSDFVMGRVRPREGYRQFQATLDWFIRPVTVRKVVEDFYNGATVPTAPTGRDGPSGVDWRDRLAKYKPRGGFWPPAWGSKPSERGPHLARAEHIAEWRKAHGVSDPAALTETIEERLESSIGSLRRAGFYDRANQAEERLSKLQGRPPVLVPSPDTAHLTGAGTDRRNEKRAPPVVFDVPPESPADREREQRMEFERVNEPPPPDEVIESEFAEGYEE